MNHLYHRRISILIVCSMAFGVCFAQTDTKADKNINPVSDNIGSSLFTGQINYTVPIYTLDDPDFPLNIQLHYQSEGFKPFQPSGFYGQNWSLVAGGCITRMVQGFPDEQQIIYYEGDHRIKDAFIGMKRAFSEGCILNKENVFNMLPPDYDSNWGPSCTCGDQGIHFWDMDYMPDIFYFNFMGYSGRFVIDNQGVPTIISGDYVNVDISGLNEVYESFGEYDSYIPVNANQYPDNSSVISITTNDGYKYTFGGDIEALEYAVLYDTVQIVPPISTWHLTSIKAPNGRTMTLQYKQTPQNQMKFLTRDYDWNEEYLVLSTNTHIMHSLQKRCILESIITSGDAPITISFFSSSEQHKMYEHPTLSYCQQNLQLDSIIVMSGERKFASARMAYMYKSSNSLLSPVNSFWRYLQSVNISGAGTYSFSYNSLNPNLPIAPPSNYIYPDIFVTTDNGYKSLVDRFGFWKASSKQGLLSKVFLPTGGQIRFTYGNHDYCEERRFHKTNTRDVELYTLPYTTNQAIGGARIKKIEIYSDADTWVETQEYTYTQPNSSLSSGVFYNMYKIYGVTNEPIEITNPYNYSMIDSHIGYSHVRRTTTTGKQLYETTYTYDTGYSYYTSANNQTIHRNINVEHYADSSELCSGSLLFNEHLRRTGSLLEVKQYNGNTLQKTTYYKYNGLPHSAINFLQEPSLGCTDTIICLSAYSGHIARKLFIFPNVLEQIATYEYSLDTGDQPLISYTSFIHDTKLRKKQVTKTDSRIRKHFTRYTYPDEISEGSSPALDSLVKHHRVSRPIEEISGYINSTTEYITSGIIHIYANREYAIIDPNQPPGPGGAIFGDVGYYPYHYQTKILALTVPITNYQPLSGNGNHLTYDSRYRLTCEYQYDILNRLTSVKPFGKVETKYTWNGFYPASKTIGNQTWTYTYLPYVGISNMTDPRGITTYYTYDSNGRLIETYRIINGVKQITNAYQYHIKTE